VVRDISFEGNEFFSSIMLRQRIETSIRRWPFISGELDMGQLERDVQIIRKAYVEEGFLAVEVDRLPPEFSDDKKSVRITFVIREGPRFVMGEAIFEGNTVFSDEQIASRLVLQPGAYFTPAKLERDLKAVEATYGELGYIEVRVTARKIYKEDQGVVDIEFTIIENDQYIVGRIEIRGNTVTEARVIRRELRFYPEQRFDLTAVTRSEHALRETQLFDEVTITPVAADEQGVRNAVVQVVEGRTAQFLVGVGVSTDSGLIGSVSLTERNFNLYNWPTSFEEMFSGRAWRGGGQTLRISAEPGTELMRFHIDWREPMLFDRPYSLGVRAFLFDRGRESYDETRYGGLVSVGHRFKNDWYGEVAARVEGVDVTNLSFDAPPEVIADMGTHLLVGLKGTLIRDRTDSRWRPSTGDRFSVSYEQVVGDYNFGRIDTAYNRYWTLYTDALDRKHIFRTRVMLGYIVGDAPVFEKYYGGGSNWLRGFAYRGITPRSVGTTEPIGGDFSLFAGCEYEFPLVGDQLRGVVFLDSGTIEREFEFGTYRASAGVGLRWTVPMFGPVPVHLDLGVPLSKDPADEEQLFNFTIGWTF
jgi:outer membrane protein assembly complex protein YaeT